MRKNELRVGNNLIHIFSIQQTHTHTRTSKKRNKDRTMKESPKWVSYVSVKWNKKNLFSVVTVTLYMVEWVRWRCVWNCEYARWKVSTAKSQSHRDSRDRRIWILVVNQSYYNPTFGINRQLMRWLIIHIAWWADSGELEDNNTL